MMATRDGYHKIVKYLLEAGADVFAGKDMFGRTALDLATLSARGQPIRFRGGETMEEARARSELVYTLLSEHVARNYNT
jgi:ankyrin repeat protein